MAPFFFVSFEISRLGLATNELEKLRINIFAPTFAAKYSIVAALFRFEVLLIFSRDAFTKRMSGFGLA
jgi:hypothetical protein